MSTELLSSEVDLDIQNEDENHDDDQTLKNMEQEIDVHAAMRTQIKERQTHPAKQRNLMNVKAKIWSINIG